MVKPPQKVMVIEEIEGTLPSGNKHDYGRAPFLIGKS